jgi:hypothetical protein
VNLHSSETLDFTTIKMMMMMMMMMMITGVELARSLQRLVYGVDDQGTGVRLSFGTKDFSLLHKIQTGSGAYRK